MNLLLRYLKQGPVCAVRMFADHLLVFLLQRYFKQQEITLYRRDESKVPTEAPQSTAPPSLA